MMSIMMCEWVIFLLCGYIGICLGEEEEGGSIACHRDDSIPNPSLKLMEKQTLMVGGVEVPLPVFSSHDINERNVAAWGV